MPKILPKIRGRVKNLGGDIGKSLLTEYEKWLEKHNKILDKVSNSIKKEIDSDPVESDNYLKTKIKYYKGKRKTSFHNGKIPKEDSDRLCLALIFINSVLSPIKPGLF